MWYTVRSAGAARAGIAMPEGNRVQVIAGSPGLPDNHQRVASDANICVRLVARDATAPGKAQRCDLHGQAVASQRDGHMLCPNTALAFEYGCGRLLCLESRLHHGNGVAPRTFLIPPGVQAEAVQYDSSEKLRDGAAGEVLRDTAGAQSRRTAERVAYFHDQVRTENCRTSIDARTDPRIRTEAGWTQATGRMLSCGTS
jgi:hypothetical protein